MVININSRMTRDQNRQAEYFARKATEQRNTAGSKVDTSVFAKTPAERQQLKDAKLLLRVALANKAQAVA